MIPRLTDTPSSDNDTTVILPEADDLDLSPDMQTPLSPPFAFEEKFPDVVKKKAVPDSPEDIEKLVVKSIISNESFFLCLYYLHEHFQSHGSYNKKEKLQFRSRILSQIEPKIGPKRLSEVTTLINNFLQLD
jgi:hypothetical protein